MTKKIILSLLFFSLLFLNVSLAYGQGILPAATGGTNGCPSGDASYCGNYTLDDFVVLAINVSRWILGIVGSLSLIMFIYGGFMFLISAGSSETVTKAKKVIVAAVIGLIIVFASYLIIKFVLGTLGINWNGQKISISQ
jgi:hypothetical protein